MKEQHVQCNSASLIWEVIKPSKLELSNTRMERKHSRTIHWNVNRYSHWFFFSSHLILSILWELNCLWKQNWTLPIERVLLLLYNIFIYSEYGYHQNVVAKFLCVFFWKKIKRDEYKWWILIWLVRFHFLLLFRSLLNDENILQSNSQLWVHKLRIYVRCVRSTSNDSFLFDD